LDLNPGELNWCPAEGFCLEHYLRWL